MLALIQVMQGIVLEELQNDTLNDALFSKGVELLSRQMNRVLARLEELNINNFASQLAQGFLSRLDRGTQRSLNKNIKNTTGVDLKPVADNSDINQLLLVKTAENVALIKSIKNDYIEDIGKVIRDNVIAGERSTRLITEIKERGDVTQSRAKFIARDQTAKTTSQLTQIRAEALGSKTYVWLASNDERTRHSHEVLDGMLCRWDDESVFSKDGGKTWVSRTSIGGVESKPGEEINCRCVSSPVVTW